ncbi:MAG: hypothetical protein WC707_07165 [Candidatus Babeliaceae bacterium]|jgi:hypothetical protein
MKIKFKLINRYHQHIANIYDPYALDMDILMQLAVLGYHIEAI